MTSLLIFSSGNFSIFNIPPLCFDCLHSSSQRKGSCLPYLLSFLFYPSTDPLEMEYLYIIKNFEVRHYFLFEVK